MTAVPEQCLHNNGKPPGFPAFSIERCPHVDHLGRSENIFSASEMVLAIVLAHS